MRITKEVEQEIFHDGIEVITECENFEEFKKLALERETVLTEEGIKIPIQGKSYLKKVKDLDEHVEIYVEEGEIVQDKIGYLSGRGNILRVRAENEGEIFSEVTLITEGNEVIGVTVAPYTKITTPYTRLPGGRVYTKTELLQEVSEETYVVVK